ncbi:glutathione ABC transporter ATP-binding protein [Rhodococcus sp. Leaf7]|uniref:ABC transporter ATP-binding protein n=1 Tax=unclassified Rhodococcus (in: high G+C Gram-positive bacteria) TaxID=192944 RepID=UPI0006F9B7F2|nr:glutathione ABC transporter ATP-binding protein [Rhodococcus sp. Leaf7]KQU43023.1 glutathione ABC transporter ATP-binding protein [Rhodococcus sp. Leaf247]
MSDDKTGPILGVSDLTIDFEVDKTWRTAVRNVSFDLARGEILAIVGESGSGKSTTAMAVPGLLADNSRVSGSITLNGRELTGLRERDLNSVRGKDIAVIFQEPMTALNPVYSIGWQITEAIRAHSDVTKAQAKERVIELLRLVEMPEPEKRVKYYPHQLSGGQRQRAMIAQALASEPSVLIADEPTTALDVTVQAEILQLMRDLRGRVNAAILLITHDMGVVADMADRILVMRGGDIVEQGTSTDIFARPEHAYTRELLASVPHLGSRAGQTGTDDTPDVRYALELTDAVIEYPGARRSGGFRAVDGVSLSIEPGEVVGLVGESGSGKSTIGKAAVGLLKLHSGSLSIAGTDITSMSTRDLRPVRKKVGIVFQDPGSSLNPRWPIGQSIGEPMLLHTDMDRGQRDKKIEELLDQVHLSRDMRNRYPHQLSGGQRQRVGIARALALEPTLLVADEPTSALDVSVQAKVLELFQELQREYGFACLFISHDLAVVEVLARRIAVMSAGKLVEFDRTDKILRSPTDPYTKRLLAAVPVPDPEQQAVRRRERAELMAAERNAGTPAS